MASVVKNKDPMKKMTVGYMALSKASWQTPKIEALMRTTLASLKKLPVDIVHGKGLTTTEFEAAELCDEFNRHGVDAIVIHLATFPVGAIIPAVAQRMSTPILLFANPEFPQMGGVLEQNSFCGANMAAHVLTKMGRKYDFAFGLPQDAAKVLAQPINVLSCIRQLRATRIGLVGGRVPGFYTSNFDEMKLRAELGVSVEVLDLLEIVNAAQKLPAADAARGLALVRKSAAGACKVSGKDLKLAGKLFQSFKKVSEKYRLTAYAVRCWPEFSDIYGIAPCAVIGMLNDARLPTSCEGDIPGAVTMQIEKELSGGLLPFFVDLISFDYKDNTAVVWHCGAAPVSLCRNFKDTALRLHMRVDGGDKKGLTNEFPLKPGRITLAKLDETGTGYRMLIASGTALDTEQIIRGNPLRVRFDGKVEALIGTIMKKGFEHHYSMVHADIKKELVAFCEWLNIETVVVE